MTKADNPEIINQFRLNMIIYYSLAVGLLLFFIVALVFIQDKDPSSGKELNAIFTMIVPFIGLLMMFLSRVIYNQMVQKFDVNSSLHQKISQYRTAKIISWAVIESACLLALVATMLTSNYLYVVVFIFLLGYFFLIKPSKESLIQDMRLSSEESDLILKS
jgi:O-antigen/teichoic acid export membrane protein